MSKNYIKNVEQLYKEKMLKSLKSCGNCDEFKGYTDTGKTTLCPYNEECKVPDLPKWKPKKLKPCKKCDLVAYSMDKKKMICLHDCFRPKAPIITKDLKCPKEMTKTELEEVVIKVAKELKDDGYPVKDVNELNKLLNRKEIQQRKRRFYKPERFKTPKSDGDILDNIISLINKMHESDDLNYEQWEIISYFHDDQVRTLIKNVRCKKRKK